MRMRNSRGPGDVRECQAVTALAKARRAVEAEPTSLAARVALVLALQREGRIEELREIAGAPRVGERVRVEERETPWIVGPWLGVLVRLVDYAAGPSRYVRPSQNVTWAEGCNPNREYVESGLYLTPEDVVEILDPAETLLARYERGESLEGREGKR